MGQAASPPVADDDMVDDEDEASLACTQARAAESVVNRQTAMLSMDVLARVLGRKYQSAFVGVLDDVTQIVTGTGPGTLPGQLFVKVGNTGVGCGGFVSSCLLRFLAHASVAVDAVHVKIRTASLLKSWILDILDNPRYLTCFFACVLWI